MVGRNARRRAQQALDDLTEAGLIEPLEVDSDACAFKNTP